MTDLQKAENALEKSQAELSRERQRLADSQAAIGALTERIKATDADDERTIAKLAGQRATAAAKAEAITARVEARTQAVHEAQNGVDAAKEAELQREVDALHEQAEQLDERFDRAVEEFGSTVGELITETQLLVRQAQPLRVPLDGRCVRGLGRILVGDHHREFTNLDAILECLANAVNEQIQERIPREYANER